MFLPPRARQRLYTTAGSYLTVLFDMLSGKVHEGPEVTALENDLRARLDVPHAIAVNQARVGLYLAVKSAVTEHRRRVIMSPFTIFDVVNMVVCAGGEPVFADVEPGSCTVDPGEVERLIDDGTAAVIVTHTHVVCRDITRICDLAHEHGAIVIEDAAVAFGTRLDKRAVGTIADVGVYSFGLFKNISAIYGGMVVTRDDDRFRAMHGEASLYPSVTTAQLRSRVRYGLTIDLATNPLVFSLLTYWVFRVGFLHDIGFINRRTANDPNPFTRTELDDSLRRRPSAMQARLVLSQLGRVQRDLETRTRLAEFYHRELKDIDGILLPPMVSDGSNGYLVFPIQVDDRAAVLRALMLAGRDCASYYYRNCADLDIFAPYGRECPNARRAANNTVLLPTYPRYGIAEAAKNVEAIRRFYEGGR